MLKNYRPVIFLAFGVFGLVFIPMKNPAIIPPTSRPPYAFSAAVGRLVVSKAIAAIIESTSTVAQSNCKIGVLLATDFFCASVLTSWIAFVDPTLVALTGNSALMLAIGADVWMLVVKVSLFDPDSVVVAKKSARGVSFSVCNSVQVFVSCKNF